MRGMPPRPAPAASWLRLAVLLAAGVLAVTVEDGTCNISDGGDSSCPSPYHVQVGLVANGGKGGLNPLTRLQTLYQFSGRNTSSGYTATYD